MSFYGTSMIFDGIACEEMGLVLYDFDSHKSEATAFASNLDIAEDRIAGRYRSLFYGGTINEPLTFKMVLCANEERASANEPFDRWDLQKISSWLTGHTTYKWLSIVQPDMEDVRYRCICTELEAVEVADNKWGFACKVTCDSPFAYLTPRKYAFTVAGAGVLSGEVFSESSYNGFYYPQLTISNHSGGDISVRIENGIEVASFTFKDLPSSIGDLRIDCENGVVTAASGANPYQYLVYGGGFHFPRFARGKNAVILEGAGIYEFTCEWPVNVGG